MADILHSTFTSGLDTQYVVIDGLDECEKTTRRDILRGLSLLSPLGSCVKIFLLGRESMSSEVGKVFMSLEHISMHRIALDNDIKTYIENTIDDRIGSEELIITQDTLREEIKQALMKGAKGM
jgi:Cdc6-like AAA superfamily ATPase